MALRLRLAAALAVLAAPACGGDGGGANIPDSEYCATVASWDADMEDEEDEILRLVNEARAAGADCGSAGTFAPTSSLAMEPRLRCAARVHSKDMVDRNFFDHTNPDGEDPFDRMARAGYSFSTAGENIASGSQSAQDTMTLWMGSAGHCANIMNPNFTEIGVGYYRSGNQHLWTQKFGTPAP